AARCPPLVVDECRVAGSVEVGGWPGGVELAEEQRAALLLVAFADQARGAPQSVEGPQEPAVLRVLPPHVARAAPAALAQPVEPPVVADAVGGVRLDGVAPEVTQTRPAV